MKSRLALLLMLLCMLHATSEALAQCALWSAGPLDNGTAPNGANGNVYAAVSWDPDDLGPLAPRLVVGGDFTSIGGVAVTNIAQRDPATGQWAPVGSGISATVNALTVFYGELVAGCSGDNNVGTFDQTVRRWDGSAWQSLSATNTGSVLAMEEYNGALYIGGTFMTHFVPGGSNDAYFLARWDPIANLWHDVEGGFGSQTNTAVRALAVYNGDLYAGGNVLGGPGTVINLARWNPATHWTQITTGTDLGGIYDFALYGGELIVGGGFLTINGATRNCIAGWNGWSFHSFSTGTAPGGGTIFNVIVHNQVLMIGGAFTTASGLSESRVASWYAAGGYWVPLGYGTDATVQSLVSYNGELVAVGYFTVAERPANHIAHWDGFQWGPFGGGFGNYVLAMTNFNGRIVAGGDFHQPTGSVATAHNVASWTGGALQSYGVGVNGPVMALKGFRYPGVVGPDELVAGGVFTQAGGIAVNNIARWTERFTVFPPPAWQAMGAGFNNAVYAIERSNGITYAGGSFTASGATSILRMARWNETTDVWEQVGFGMNGFVYALKDYNGYLYAGGNFTSAGGSATGGLARWTGTFWDLVGGGAFGGTVLSLEVYDGKLVIGGQFSGISHSPNLIVYDGVSFSALATGGANNNVRALKTNGRRLYVAGDFTSVAGVLVNRVAYWEEGNWHDTHYGTDNIVYALGTYNNEVHVGGSFLNVDYGGPSPALTSPFWGRYSETGLPWFYQHPASKTVQLGDDVSFTAQAASGFSGLTYQWYHNDLPISDGPTGNGSTIGGATTTTLTILDAVWTDHGGYRLVATNSCGDATSFTATLDFTGVTAAPSPGSVRTTVFEALGPNPAGGASQLSFSLAHDAAVRVRIYDVAGRLVRHIDVGRLPAGHHMTSWDARDEGGRKVSAAQYFVRLDVDGQPIGSKRLTILH
jgi:hypothetical protein